MVRHLYHKLCGVLATDQGDILIRNIPAGVISNQEQIFIPSSNEKLKREVFRWSQEHISAGHFGRDAMYLWAS